MIFISVASNKVSKLVGSIAGYAPEYQIILNNMKILCLLKSLWRTLVNFSDVSGHTFVEGEEHKNVNVYIDYCEDCGKPEISWQRNVRNLKENIDV